MAYEGTPYTPGDWLQGRQFDENGRAINFAPSQLNTVNGQAQQADFGDYFTGLMNQGIISPTNMRAGSDNYGGQGNQWFNGTDNNIYRVNGENQLERIPMSNIDPQTGKDTPGALSYFLDPKTGAQVSTGKADFAKVDPGEMAALAIIMAASGGAAGAAMGGAGAAAEGVGGAGGFIGEGAASGIPAWDGALAAAPSWTAPAAAGVGGAATFNPAADSQLASQQLGLTAADTSSATIPSVTVNGAPSSMWSTLFPNTGTDSLTSPWEKIGQAALKKAGTSLLTKGMSGLSGGSGGGSPGGMSLSLPQSQPSTSVSPAPGYYSIASTPKNPYTLGLMRGSNGN